MNIQKTNLYLSKRLKTDRSEVRDEELGFVYLLRFCREATEGNLGMEMREVERQHSPRETVGPAATVMGFCDVWFEQKMKEGKGRWARPRENTHRDRPLIPSVRPVTTVTKSDFHERREGTNSGSL